MLEQFGLNCKYDIYVHNNVNDRRELEYKSRLCIENG